VIEDIFFSSPEILWAVPAIVLLGLVYLRRSRDRILVISRILVLCLIAIALANPYVVATHTVESSRPSITFLDDQTDSMEVFDTSTADRLSQRFPDSQMRTITGNSTPLGDRILQYASQGSAVVLVSDGYSNKGRPLNEAVGLAKASNTTVFAISMVPDKVDASVTLEGTNTAVMGGDYPFTAVVRCSGPYDGTLNVFADDQVIYSGRVTTNSSSSIKISQRFSTMGTHVLRAAISSDLQPINNEYQKAVYVVPKPSVLLVPGGQSPLSTVMSGMYDLKSEESLPPSQNYRDYKAVVLDDQPYSLGLNALRDYVRDGGGLVVVGGQNSYELGGYLNTSFEQALPVRAVPSTFEGGKTLILVLDISFSLMGTRAADGTPLLDYEKSLAIELLKSPDFQDYRVGVVVFGTKAYVVSVPVPLSRSEAVIEERIASLSPTGLENSYLDSGLQLAWDMLNESTGKGEVIVLSDGNLWNYEDVFMHSSRLIREMNATTRLVQVQAFPDARGRFPELAAETGADISLLTYPSSITTRVEEAPPVNETKPQAPQTGYAIAVVNQNHYITTGLGLNTTINGFNDVTPRPGAQRLVAMEDGKPVLTTWRYGLGRVAALSTDDGTSWAPQLYTAESSKLISAMVNWAVGDPRPEENRIDAEDGWLGTPLEIDITSATRPSLGPGVSVEKTGEDRYTAMLNPAAVGIYYLGDYGIAVNYPLEYRDVGFNPDLSRIIMANGGRVFTESEAYDSLIDEARRSSERTVQERTSRRDLLLLAALMIFLGEVVGRRLREIKRRSRR